MPLIAGMFAMPFWRFQIANFTSAFVWAAVLLTLGDVTSTTIKWLAELMGAAEKTLPGLGPGRARSALRLAIYFSA